MLLLGTNCSSADSSTNGNIFVTLSDPLTSLSEPVWTNGQVQFILNGESNVNYVIESSPDLVNWTPVATNLAAPSITVAAPDNAGFYRASRTPLPLFAYAVAARGNININGLGLLTDSFNSSDTNLSTDGQYDFTKTSTNGNVACVSGIVNIGNHYMDGSLYLGPTGTNNSSTNQIVGEIYTNFNVQFPDVVLPATDANGYPIVWQPAPTITNTTYKKPIYIHDFTTANNNGYYTVGDSDAITVETGVMVTLWVTASNYAPASITIEGGTTNSGTLVMYQSSGNATLAGNSFGGPIGNRPQNFVYFGLPGVNGVLVSYVSGGLTNIEVGTIYAPDAAAIISAGGSVNGFSGSCVAHDVHINGHFTFHYDESLLTSGPFR